MICPAMSSPDVSVFGPMVISSMLPAFNLAARVSEWPMVTSWTAPGCVSDRVPLKSPRPTWIVDFSKANRFSVPLKSCAQVALRLSLLDEPPLIVVVAGRLAPLETLMEKVLPPEPRLMLRVTRPL